VDTLFGGEDDEAQFDTIDGSSVSAKVRLGTIKIA
jgi:hypothetical protein